MAFNSLLMSRTAAAGYALILGSLALSSATTSFAQGNPAGQCRAALRPLLLQAKPDQERLARARHICRAEADAGDPEAAYQLSFFYLGLVTWDVEEATSIILTAAETGVSEAQYWLAWQYETGPLLPNDSSRALRWYEVAAENEHRLALARLAVAYENGELGLEVDGRRASLLRARAARCGKKVS
jgi:TPR repeat protein